MEYTFTVKHIKGSSNSTADSLSRLPVNTPGTDSAPFPVVHDASGMALPKCMTGLPTVQKLNVSVVDSEVMGNVQHLACNPSLAVAPITILQVVGDSPVAAWDILPLTTKEVTAATKTDRVYGKLFLCS